jgi:hypothetical protein
VTITVVGCSVHVTVHGVGTFKYWSRISPPPKDDGVVGPWGWAARMIRQDELVSAAALLGCDFNKDEWPYYLRDPDNYHGKCVYVPKWRYAELWLEHRGVQIGH